jgi:CDGSH-type Zn-finger protein
MVGYRVGDAHPTFFKEKIMEENKLEQVMCGCGRSSTGYCTGLHSLTEEEYEEYLLQGLHDLEEGSE